jgi:hypothetical protein
MADFSDGKVLRSKDVTLFVPDLVVMLNYLRGGSIEDLRTHDKLEQHIKPALGAFGEEYDAALAAVDDEVAEKNIVNEIAVGMLREQALRPLFRKYATTEAADVLVSGSEWSWALKKYKAGQNFDGSDEGKRRTLRIADVLEHPLGYKIDPANKSIAIEGDDTEPKAKLKAV